MKRFASVFILGILLLTVLIAPTVSADETQVTYTPEQLLAVWNQVVVLMREAECYPYVDLQKGDRGYEVVFLQTRLAQLNYYSKTIDPQYGSGTYSAMRQFEKANGLKVDGKASVEDQRLLFRSDAKPKPGTEVGLENGQTLPPDLVPTETPTPTMLLTPTPTSTPASTASQTSTPPPFSTVTPSPTPMITGWPGFQTVKPLISGFDLPDLVVATPFPTPMITIWPGFQTVKPLVSEFDVPDLSIP